MFTRDRAKRDARCTNSTDNETLDVESDNKRNHSMIKMHIPLSYLRELPQRKVKMKKQTEDGQLHLLCTDLKTVSM